MRATKEASFLRTQRVFDEVRRCLRGGQRNDFRIVQFSVQRDHVHLLVEAQDAVRLSRGMQGLAIRLARGVNRAMTRARGKVWAERYHRRDLTSPREVRHALVYVLQNHMKHGPAAPPKAGPHGAMSLDACSSALWFDGWNAHAAPLLAGLAERDPSTGHPPVVAPKTWLAREGWRRHRLLDPAEAPPS